MNIYSSKSKIVNYYLSAFGEYVSRSNFSQMQHISCSKRSHLATDHLEILAKYKITNYALVVEISKKNVP